jgi:hypothetical protein
LSLYTNHILTFRFDLIMERGTNQDSSVTTVTRLSPRAESDGLIFVHSLRSFTSQRGTNLDCKFKVLPYPTSPFSNRDPNSFSFRVWLRQLESLKTYLSPKYLTQKNYKNFPAKSTFIHAKTLH